MSLFPYCLHILSLTFVTFESILDLYFFIDPALLVAAVTATTTLLLILFGADPDPKSDDPKSDDPKSDAAEKPGPHYSETMRLMIFVTFVATVIALFAATFVLADPVLIIPSQDILAQAEAEKLAPLLDLLMHHFNPPTLQDLPCEDHRVVGKMVLDCLLNSTETHNRVAAYTVGIMFDYADDHAGFSNFSEYLLVENADWILNRFVRDFLNSHEFDTLLMQHSTGQIGPLDIEDAFCTSVDPDNVKFRIIALQTKALFDVIIEISGGAQ